VASRSPKTVRASAAAPAQWEAPSKYDKTGAKAYRSAPSGKSPKSATVPGEGPAAPSGAPDTSDNEPKMEWLKGTPLPAKQVDWGRGERRWGHAAPPPALFGFIDANLAARMTQSIAGLFPPLTGMNQTSAALSTALEQQLSVMDTALDGGFSRWGSPAPAPARGQASRSRRGPADYSAEPLAADSPTSASPAETPLASAQRSRRSPHEVPDEVTDGAAAPQGASARKPPRSSSRDFESVAPSANGLAPDAADTAARFQNMLITVAKNLDQGISAVWGANGAPTSAFPFMPNLRSGALVASPAPSRKAAAAAEKVVAAPDSEDGEFS
jgi:hypothetical protein